MFGSDGGGSRVVCVGGIVLERKVDRHRGDGERWMKEMSWKERRFDRNEALRSSQINVLVG